MYATVNSDSTCGGDTSPESQKQRSRFRGVAWDSKHDSWRVKIFYRGKQRHVGRYYDEVEAAKAYDAAAVYLYGGYATTNFGLAATLSAGTKVSNPIVKARLLTDLAEQQGACSTAVEPRHFNNLAASQQQQHLNAPGNGAAAAAAAAETLQRAPSGVSSGEMHFTADRSSSSATSSSTATGFLSTDSSANTALPGLASGPGTWRPLAPPHQHYQHTPAGHVSGFQVPLQQAMSQQAAMVQQNILPVVFPQSSQPSSLSQLAMSNVPHQSCSTQQPAVLTQQQLPLHIPEHILLHQQPGNQQVLQQQQQQHLLLPTAAPARAQLQLTSNQLTVSSNMVSYPEPQLVANMPYTQVPLQGTFLQSTSGAFAAPEAPITYVLQQTDGSRLLGLQSSTGMQGTVLYSGAQQQVVAHNNEGPNCLVLQLPSLPQAHHEVQPQALLTYRDGQQYQVLFSPADALVEQLGLDASASSSIAQTANAAGIIEAATYKVWGSTPGLSNHPM